MHICVSTWVPDLLTPQLSGSAHSLQGLSVQSSGICNDNWHVLGELFAWCSERATSGVQGKMNQSSYAWSTILVWLAPFYRTLATRS